MGFFYSGGSGMCFRRLWNVFPEALDNVSGGSGTNSEWCRAFYFYLITREGVCEGKASGMQIHPFSRSVAIKWVAKYRSPQSVRVGTVNSQLVCSASEREEPYSVLVYKFITGDSLLALFIIHLLHGTVLKIRGER